MDSKARVRVLGAIDVVVAERRLDVGGPRQRRLLASLVVDAGQAVSGDVLVDRVWSNDELPSDPRAALRTYVARLRQVLAVPEALVTQAPGWRLDDSVVEIDASRFVALVESANDPGLDVHQRLARLDEALGLWRGDAFEEFAAEDWARGKADRLNELRVTALERRYEAMLAAGMHTDALPGLVGAVEAHPLRDRLVGLQMLALFRSGRGVEATRVFQAHRARLAEELGLEPGTELVQLDRRVVVGDASLLLASAPGRALRGYRLGEQLGEGAFAVVFRGTQPSVGRDVAVKIIRSELANRAEFIRRFEAEAHLVARLEHPFIVPLYDYWREPDRACLVFRYLRGGTLEQRLSASGGLSVAECRTMVDEVGAALSAAHAAGVIHRDVKPANVLLDEGGNFFLGDFGIALDATELSDPTAALSAGSPAYASPEQLRREPIGPSADVHGLGISIYEALTGRLPFPAAISQVDLLHRQLHDPIPLVRDFRADVPAAVDVVLAKATAKDPTERYQTIEELVVEFTAALDVGPAALVTRAGTTTRVALGEARNPYKALRAFTEADSADFFGRERLVDRLVEVLARTGTEGRIAAVVGPSGIGKSSVVRAGLLPALRSGAVDGSDRWFVATMFPGRHPFDELAAALLRVATRAPDNMMGLLTEDRRGVARVVKAIAPQGDRGDVLLVIDQFEELFTLAEDDKVTRLFLESLGYALTDARCPLRVVLTIRADFWDRPLRHGSFARLIDASTVNVTALAPDELERAIIEPAHRAGAEFEPGLVSEMVAGLTDQPGALPLLQYALTELWEQQVSGLLTRDAYQRLGGVAGALTRRADDLYQSANPDERDRIRSLFGRLVTPGEGTEDTRRRALLSELTTVAAARHVIDTYGTARLLSFDADPNTREPTVEVAHEALIRQWPRLREWLDEDRDDIRTQRHLHTSATEWHDAGRPDAELYRGGRLESAEEWAVEHGEQLMELDRAFLDASVTLRHREEDLEKERFSRQARDNRRLKTLLSVVAIVAVLALAAGVVAFRQRSRANDEAAEAERQAQQATDARDGAASLGFHAETRRLIADAAARIDEDPTVALLLAAEAARREPGARTDAGLQTVLTSLGPHLGTLAAGEDVLAASWLDDGLVAAVFGRTLATYDAESGEIVSELQLPANPEPGPVGIGHPTRPLVAGEHLVAVALEGGSVAVSDGTDVRRIDASDQIISTIGLLKNDRYLAVGDTSGALALFDLTDGPDDSMVWRTQVILDSSLSDLMSEEARASYDAAGIDPSRDPRTFDSLYFGSGPLGVGELPGGDIVVAAGVHVRRLDSRDGRIVGEHLLETEGIPGLPPIPRWARGLDQADDGTVHLELGITQGWVEVPPDFSEPVFHTDAVGTDWLADLAVSPSGDVWFANVLGRFMAVSGDENGQHEISQLAELRTLAVSPNGDELLLIGNGGILRRSLNGDQLLAAAIPHAVDNGSLSISGDGEMLSIGLSGQQGSRLIDMSGETLRDIELDEETRKRWLWMGADPLDRFVSAYGSSEDLRLINRTTQQDEGIVFPSHSSGEAYSHDGRYAAIGDNDSPIVRVYEIETNRQVSPDLDLNAITGADGTNVSSLDFNPDGTRLFASLRSFEESNGTAAIFDTATWEQTGDTLATTDHGGAAEGIFAPNGDLVTIGADGSIAIRNPDSLDPVAVLAGGTEAADISTLGPFVSADGEYLLTLRFGAPRLWHLPTRSLIGSFPYDPSISVGGSGAGEQLRLVTSLDGRAMVWNLDVDSWLDVACRAAGRNLTLDEWQLLGPEDADYEATCPQWPEPTR